MPDQKKENDGRIVIENGKRLREWLIFAGSVVGVIATAVLLWAALCSRVEVLEASAAAIAQSGTSLSQANQRDIIGMKADIRYTRAAVDKIDTKLERLTTHIQ